MGIDRLDPLHDKDRVVLGEQLRSLAFLLREMIELVQRNPNAYAFLMQQAPCLTQFRWDLVHFVPTAIEYLEERLNQEIW